MSTLSAAAVDLGASGGRVMTATVGDGVLDLREVHRFPNRPVTVGGTLHWDVLALYAGIVEGLAAAGHTATGVDSIGIDSWAIDYGVLDGSGTEADVIALNPRTASQFGACAAAGADATAVTPDVLRDLLVHPLTDRGIDRFLRELSQRHVTWTVV